MQKKPPKSQKKAQNLKKNRKSPKFQNSQKSPKKPEFFWVIQFRIVQNELWCTWAFFFIEAVKKSPGIKILSLLINFYSSRHGIKKTRYDRCLRPPSRIEPIMRVKLKSKRRSPVCIQLISCTVLKREICYV